MLKTQEKRALLQIARSAIRSVLENREPDYPPEPGAGVEQKAGVFVTLRLQGKLRGCVGLIESDRPLKVTVGEVARKAAFEDPRFQPLTVTELESAEFEVSILSQLQPLKLFDELEVGLHGIIVESGAHRGLLLPQVALEFGWNREEFVNAVLQKAGLPSTAVSDPSTRFYSFLTERITENEGELV
jgi:AmmeMemoRadiSam system protein A